MSYQVIELSADSIKDYQYGSNSLIDDQSLEQELGHFGKLNGLFHNGKLLWFVVSHQDHWVATNPITTPVFDYYLKNICSLENKEPQDIGGVKDDGEMLSYYVEGGCGGPGWYELNDETTYCHVYMSMGTADRVTKDFGMEWITKDQFQCLFSPKGDEEGYVNNGSSAFSPEGFSVPIGLPTGFKEWGNGAMMLPLAGAFNIFTQGYEHAFLRLAIEKFKADSA